MDKYWNDSPHKYVANVKTPTIFLIGEKGRRAWPQRAVQMYRALHNGVPTRVQPAPREPHGGNELRHQLFKIKRGARTVREVRDARLHERPSRVATVGGAPRRTRHVQKSPE